MKLSILTIHPKIVKAFFLEGLLAKALSDGKVDLEIVDIRKFADPPHYRVDDKPYGGGAGMVLKVDCVDRALMQVLKSETTLGKKASLSRSGTLRSSQKRRIHISILSAKGRRFTQTTARQWAKLDHLVLVCGRYEGIDERVKTLWANSEVRIGDYVLMGGEVASGVIAEAVTRLIPGVLGNPGSLLEESFSKPNLKEYPQYTRPEKYKGLNVPKVLLSGNHREIKCFRKSLK